MKIEQKELELLRQKPNLKILAIESSCDDTSVAICRGREVLSNVVATQIAEHALYGGVVPEIASRRHLEAISGTTPPYSS